VGVGLGVGVAVGVAVGVEVGVTVGVGVEVGVADAVAGCLSVKASCCDWPPIDTRPSAHEVMCLLTIAEP